MTKGLALSSRECLLVNLEISGYSLRATSSKSERKGKVVPNTRVVNQHAGTVGTLVASRRGQYDYAGEGPLTLTISTQVPFPDVQ